MDYRLLMDTAILAGEIMLKNGAETYRVEDTVQRILETGKVKHTQVVAMTTSIIASISNPDMNPITVVRRINERGTNLNKVYLVNNVSREYCNNLIDLETAFTKLKNVQTVREYSYLLKNIAQIILVPLFVVLLGGIPFDMGIGLINGVILITTLVLSEKIGLNVFVRDIIIAFMVAVFTKLVYNTFGAINVEIIIISSIMPMVPGVAITNAIRDTLQGDYMSGGARTIEAFVKALSIALGVYLGLSL